MNSENTPSPESHLVGADMREHFSQTILDQMGESKTPVLMNPIDEEETSDGICREADGCPTEKAVLQRFWREHHNTPPQTNMDSWQYISSAPRDGSEVLIWNGRRRHVAHFDKIEGEWVSSFKTTTKRLVVAPPPTHWSPLLAEPATAEGQP